MQQTKDLFLEIALKDVNERFIKFKNETENIFFVSRKICFNHSKSRWSGSIDVIEYFKTQIINISIPCLFDFKTYYEMPETHFKYLKDILTFLTEFDGSESSQISIFIYKKVLNLKLVGKHITLHIKFYNDEPLFNEKKYNIKQIKEIMQ